jgi:hypothetical protein
VEELRRLGHDVLTTLDAGKANQRILDGEVLAFAVRLQRAVLTLNRRHFLRPAKERPDHAGLILCTYDPDFLRQREPFTPPLAVASSLTGSCCV